MRLTSLAVLALVSSLTLVGCGDDAGDISLKDRATTTEAGSDGTDEGDTGDTGDSGSDAEREAFIEGILSSDAPLDEDQAGCLADETLPSISDEGRETITSDESFDLSDLTDDDADTFVAALDTCLPLDGLVVDFTAATLDEIGVDLTDDELECTADAIGADFEGSGDFLRNATADDGETGAALLFGALGDCMSDDTAIAFFSAAMADTSIPPDVAECIATEIVGQIGGGPLLELFIDAGNGETSDLESLTADAALVCDPSGTYDESGEIPVPSIGGGLSGQ